MAAVSAISIRTHENINGVSLLSVKRGACLSLEKRGRKETSEQENNFLL
jgi:hypothetical protein